jgi:hypothetical protein
MCNLQIFVTFGRISTWRVRDRWLALSLHPRSGVLNNLENNDFSFNLIKKLVNIKKVSQGNNRGVSATKSRPMSVVVLPA